MESERFDTVVRALSTGATRRGALSLLAGIAGLGVSEVAARRRGRRSRQSTRRTLAGEAQSADKVTICHRTTSTKHPFQVITVDASAVPDHEAHGDLVRCPNLQVIDLETCACVCPVEEIACGSGQQLDPERCQCVSTGPEDCTSNLCRRCRRMPDGFCDCATKACPIGETCDPDTGNCS
jgi:hypothetical protein